MINNNNNKILLIDGDSLLYRVFYATTYNNNKDIKILKSFNNVSINAVFIFVKIINKLIKQNNYFSYFVAFDKNKKNFRHILFNEYKSKRKKTPIDLLEQKKIIKEFLYCLNIPYLEIDNYEADDIIGFLSKKAEEKNYFVDILSSDKDFFQLINKKINVLLIKKGFSNIEIYNEKKILEEFNIFPKQIIDLKSLMGDKSDNLKGIPGFGKKISLELIKKFNNIEEIYDNLNLILNNNYKRKLIIFKNNVFLFKKILTIVCDIDYKEIVFEKYIFNEKKILDFYLKYNMFSLIKKNNFFIEDKENIFFLKNKNLKIKVLNKWDEKYISKINVIYLELLNKNYHISEPIAFFIINEKGNFYYNFLIAKTDLFFLDFLKNFNYKKWTYDAKSIIVNLNKYNIIINNITYDMMIASYICNPDIKSSIISYINLFSKDFFLLDNLFFNKKNIDKKIINNNFNQFINFVFNKSFFIYKLHDKIINILKKNKQYFLYKEIEFPLIFILSKIEIFGIKVDLIELENQILKIKKIINNLKNEIILFSGIQNFNPNSNNQISDLLFNKLKLPNYKKSSTSKEILNNIKYKHFIVFKIINYRKYQKLFSTYLLGIKKYIFEDKKIHTIYNQTSTITGRLSSSEPNIQNITIKDNIQREVRKIFTVSNKNNFLLSFDYSQIELRILAHMSKDIKLINLLNENKDFHTITAMKIFNLSKNQVNSDIRRNAKKINFGIIYGISYFTLAKDLNISILDSKKIIDSYYQKFPKIKKFINKQIDFCQKNGYVKTIFNRKRYIKEINDNNYNKKEFAKRICVNTPIQGSVADILKIVLKNIFKKFNDLNINSNIIAQIHDELIIEVLPNELEKVKNIVKEIMESSIKLSVKLDVNINLGKNWYDLIK